MGDRKEYRGGDKKNSNNNNNTNYNNQPRNTDLYVKQQDLQKTTNTTNNTQTSDNSNQQISIQSPEFAPPKNLVEEPNNSNNNHTNNSTNVNQQTSEKPQRPKEGPKEDLYKRQSEYEPKEQTENSGYVSQNSKQEIKETKEPRGNERDNKREDTKFGNNRYERKPNNYNSGETDYKQRNKGGYDNSKATLPNQIESETGVVGDNQAPYKKPNNNNNNNNSRSGNNYNNNNSNNRNSGNNNRNNNINSQREENKENQKDSKNQMIREKYGQKQADSQDLQSVTSESSTPSNPNDRVLRLGNEQFDLSEIPQAERTEILIKLFKKRKVECPVCFNKIKNEHQIWNCQQCNQPFHLACMKTWIENSNKNSKKADDPPNQDLKWSCPKCCCAYLDRMPEYYCFCNKFKNPLLDQAFLPHSCGEICEQKRGNQCPHTCPMPCHPGPCPPCQQQGEKIPCHCGQNILQIKCSDNRTNHECGDFCLKVLKCGNHKCQQKCHATDCNLCPIRKEVACHCGNQQRSMPCGVQTFECASECQQILNCGYHQCQNLCHAGPCQSCPYEPKQVTQCPCGKMSLDLLMGTNARKQCSDPIAICGLPCKKSLECKQHFCKLTCHEGQCPPCQVIVEQFCKCNKVERELECHEARDGFSCEKRCKQKLQCGVHKCDNLCCLIPPQAHYCLKVCDKDLPCGFHQCGEFCHLGNCQKCTITVITPITCVCQQTKIMPPQPCGTQKPLCLFPCSRQKDCGHPCPLQCHQDACPPCVFPVKKICRCGQNQMNDISCSKDVLCHDKCGKELNCGHFCQDICHIGQCQKYNLEDGCGQICTKPRKFCEHICNNSCHPGTDCPQGQCQVQIKVQCQCGNRDVYVKCSVDEEPIQHELPCNNVCLNLKRFGTLYDASKKKIYYSPMLLRFAKEYMPFLRKLEERIENMIKSDTKSFDVNVGNDQVQQHGVQVLLNRHYNLDANYYYNQTNPFFSVSVADNCMIPKPPLSQYFTKVEKGLIKPECLPFQASLKFVGVGRNDSIEFLEQTLLKELAGEFYVSKEQRFFYLHFWKKEDAEEACKKLKKSQTTFSNFSYEENMKLLDDETQEIKAVNEVITTKITFFQLRNSQMKTKLDQVEPELIRLYSDKQENEVNLSKEIISQRERFADRARCYTKCPEQEINERESQMDLDIFEQDPNSSEMKAKRKWVIQKYFRSGIGESQQEEKNPENVRSPDAVLKTVHYLMNYVMDADTDMNSHFRIPLDNRGRQRMINYQDIFNFMSNRLIACLKDLNDAGDTIFTIEAVQSLETSIQFFIIGLFQYRSDPDYEQKWIINQIHAFSSSIHQVYEMLKTDPSRFHSSCIEEIIDKHQPSFVAYTLILLANSPLQFQKFLVQIDQATLNSERVQIALDIIKAFNTNDFSEFFKILEKTDYIMACCIFPYVSQIRSQAISILVKSQNSLLVSEIQKILYFYDRDETRDFLSAYGYETPELDYETEEEEEEEANSGQEKKNQAESEKTDKQTEDKTVKAENDHQAENEEKKILGQEGQSSEIEVEKPKKIQTNYIDWKKQVDFQQNEIKQDYCQNIFNQKRVSSFKEIEEELPIQLRKAEVLPRSFFISKKY